MPDPSMLSDGCSVPRALRFFLPYENGEQRLCCVAHDQAYARGGSEKDKAIADADLLKCLLVANLEPRIALDYHASVTHFGGSHFNYHRGA